MWRLSLLLLASSLLAALAVAGWLALRSSGMVQGPPEHLAEIIAICIPIVPFVLGVLAIFAARNHDLPGRIPNTLPHRLFPSSTSTLTTSLVTFAAVLTTGVLVLSFVFVVSLFPRSWSDSWECEATDDGNSCDLVDGTWYQYAIFILICLVDPLYVIGGPILVFAAMVSLTRRIHAPHPIIEVSSQGAFPGGRFEVYVAQHGSGLSRGFDVHLQCIEVAQWSAGSSTSSESRTVYDLPVLQHPGGQFTRTAPLQARGTAVVPVGAMHSFKSEHNEIKWVLNVRGEASGISTDQSLRLLVVPTPLRGVR